MYVSPFPTERFPELTGFLDRKDDLERCLDDQIEYCDAVWPIAPETGGILERICRRVESAGKTLLASSGDGVSLAASKFETVKRLEKRVSQQFRHLR